MLLQILAIPLTGILTVILTDRLNHWGRPKWVVQVVIASLHNRHQNETAKASGSMLYFWIPAMHSPLSFTLLSCAVLGHLPSVTVSPTCYTPLSSARWPSPETWAWILSSGWRRPGRRHAPSGQWDRTSGGQTGTALTVRTSPDQVAQHSKNTEQS